MTDAEYKECTLALKNLADIKVLGKPSFSPKRFKCY